MSHRSFALFSAAAAMAMAPANIVAQAPPPGAAKQAIPSNRARSSKAWTTPRTADGRPDLQGIWGTATLTPFERPKELAGKEFFSAEEAAEFTRTALERANRDRRGATPEADVGGAYNEAWFDRGTKVQSNLRTSIVVDPADGRVPPLTPQASQAAAARAAVQRRRPEGPEDFALAIRCILWPTAGPPMIPGPYNNYYQIVQTRDFIAIYVEMIHDVRIIPLDERPQLPDNVRQWTGSYRGHWEGETLVVESRNFNGKNPFQGSSENMRLTERFTRVGPNEIRYQFTVDDPSTWTRAWSAEVPWAKTIGPIFEHACHEGNYGLANTLSGARVEEKRAAEGANKK